MRGGSGSLKLTTELAVAAQPCHGARQAVFVSSLRRQIHVVIGGVQHVQSARIARVGVEDVALALVEHADARPLRTGKPGFTEVVNHLAFRHLIRRERNVKISIEIAVKR